MIARSSESLTLWKQPEKPAKLTDDESEVNLVYKLSNGKDAQMGNHKDVTKNDEQRLGQDWRNGVRLTYVYLKFEDELLEMLSKFEQM